MSSRFTPLISTFCDSAKVPPEIFDNRIKEEPIEPVDNTELIRMIAPSE